MLYQVKQVVAISGVSVRTLHHYDQIGLLKPASVSPAGYRLYSQHDLEKLQHILFYKELDFNLEEIRHLLDLQGQKKNKLLQAQHRLLLKKQERLKKIITTLEHMMHPKKGAKKMTQESIFKAFDNSDFESHQKQFAAEAEKLYGHTNAYKESRARAKKYSKQDWAKIMNEGNRIYQEIANNMDKAPDHEVIRKLVRAWQEHISRYFYECSTEMLSGLGELYVNDQRFTENIDKIKPGLAGYLNKAIASYCKKA